MKPTFEEFKEAARKISGIYAKDGTVFGKYLPFADDELFCYYEWIGSGRSGGNCWGDDPRPEEPEQEPDDNCFTRILEQFADDISYMKFRKISREVLVETDRYESGYYGNYIEYNVKAFSLKKLYEAIYGDDK